MTPANLAECLAHLAKKGVAVRLNGDILEIRDMRAEKLRERKRCEYIRRKQAKSGETRQKAVKSGEMWRGIEWRDVPGRDEAAKKMRFSLLKRGDWKGYKSCQYLEGDALKREFARINESQKSKSQKAALLRTEEAKARKNQQP